MVAVCLVGLVGCVALAIDIGLIAVARTELQDAADAAVLAGARMLDGQSVGNNATGAVQLARNVAKINTMVGAPITDADITDCRVGVYRYDPTANPPGFRVDYSAPGANENYGALTLSLTKSQPTIFARVFGINAMEISTFATAVARPRDVALILDFSGSMQFSSERNYNWNAIKAGTPLGTASLNIDPVFPRFGPWSLFSAADPNVITVGDPASASPNLPISPMQSTVVALDPTTNKTVTDPVTGNPVVVQGGGETHAPSNLTYPTKAGPPIIRDFSYVSIDSAQNPPVMTGSSNAFHNPQAGTYDPLSMTAATVTPAPEDLADQNCTLWNNNPNLGDRFPLKTGITQPAAQAVGTLTPAIPPASYAKNVYDLLAATDKAALGSLPLANNHPPLNAAGKWEDPGPAGGYGPNFKGYTMGPGYYGKTFYMWPPDPRTPSDKKRPGPGQATPTITNVNGDYVPGDWRKRFFVYPNSTKRMDDNSRLWNTTNGQWRGRGTSTYAIDYNAVMAWINSGPQVFPPSLRSGRVLYYSRIPTTINVPLGSTSTDPTDPDELFWKRYIDDVLSSSGSNAYGMNVSSNVGGLKQVWAGQNYGTVNIKKFSDLTGSPKPYMRYDENPVHPRLGFWFGPLSMLCFLYSNNNMLPGTCHEAQCWQLKAGIQAALEDIKKNHPNDLVTLIYFSASSGYGVPRQTLSNKYKDMQNLLWYPFSIPATASPPTGPATYLGDPSQEVRPYNVPWGSLPAGILPNARGGTGPDLGFILAFNQFSAAAGYNGRIGAAKLCIFETDGVPHNYSKPPFQGNGPNQSFYSGVDTSIAIKDTGQVSTFLDDLSKRAARDVVRRMCMPDPNNWGLATNMWGGTADYYAHSYSNGGKTARVHCIAFGDIFETNVPSPLRQAALDFLSFVQVDGNTTQKGPPSGSYPGESYAPVITLPKVEATTALEDYKIINGDAATRIEKLRQALERIMQGDVAISLVQ
jgi:hypothetical protein